ncbi:MAG: hypothetical protein ACREQJ_09600 [Candidatus Binatia bacterium]
MAKRAVLLSRDAVRQWRRLGAKDRSRLLDAMRASLAEDDATIEAKNRFRLRRPSSRAEYELRVGDLRAFYVVEGGDVKVALIGKKVRNALVIDGKKVIL